ncbi:hypothetical protein HCB26_06115 [Listeria booriae]|uniref:Uncharacterized protein n=1 Tax=Listeria booriae TaxID=1552123 RepID=A0A7X0YZC9_9LIST|nr:hypothetical protein [Listeria booriae]MBC2166140.1 hypothetical protein [Listeria booriae]
MNVGVVIILFILIVIFYSILYSVHKTLKEAARELARRHDPIELPLTSHGIKQAYNNSTPIKLFGKSYKIWEYEAQSYSCGGILHKFRITRINDDSSLYRQGYKVVIKEYYDGSTSVDLERELA